MKKISFRLLAIILASTLAFTSCNKDDDDDDDSKISKLSATLNGENFSTSTAGFYAATSSSASTTGTNVLSNIFGSDGSKTTIAGTKDSKQLAININGITSGTYELKIPTSQTTINNTLISLLTGGTVKDAISDAIDGVETDALIIYRNANDSEGSDSYWFSTEASVTINIFAIYATGTFSATMRNKAGDTFSFSDGEFQIFGITKPSAK